MQLLNSNLEVVNELQFGQVAAGEYKDIEYFLYNENEVAELLSISVEIKHPEITILDYPKSLLQKEKGSLKVRWSPSLKVEEGLRVKIKIGYQALYPPPK